jgi:phosphoribosylaminoimidazole-succinocarboxamide synthase
LKCLAPASCPLPAGQKPYRPISMTLLTLSDLPLPLLARGKVRDVYAVGDDQLLLVASDRISAFDVVMNEPVPFKGLVLTQLSIWWFDQLDAVTPHHLISADTETIIAAIPSLAPYRAQIAGRTMLCRRTQVVPFECVVRGYISGSAWKDYQATGTLAGEALKAGLQESDRLDPALFSPATKAESGHDENIGVADLYARLGQDLASELEALSRKIYEFGRTKAAERGIIIADTKFEFGRDPSGQIILIDEVMTPDSSRFWPADQYAPGRGQPSFDKQPLRDWLDAERASGRWNGEAPAPPLPPQVIAATSERYLAVYALLTGKTLDIDAFH